MNHASLFAVSFALLSAAACVVEDVDTDYRKGVAPEPAAAVAVVDPVADDAGQCCVSECCGDTDTSPFPGLPEDFECPVSDMPYCPDGVHFDCDDFSYACKLWGDHNDVNICQVIYTIDPVGGGDPGGHAINAVEFDYPYSDVLHKWCLIEPQDNSTYCCWIQGEGDPVPPQSCLDTACAAFDGQTGPDHCWGVVVCEDMHCGDEACFLTDQEACDRFEEETGVCLSDWKPIK